VPAFPDNTDFIAEVNGETIDLPLRGKVFRFSGSPSLAEGAQLLEMRRKIEAVAKGELPPETIVIDDQRALYVRLIGDQYDALTAAGVTEAELALIGSTLLNSYLYGYEAGVQTWTGALQKRMAEQGEAAPTGTTTAPPKAKQPSRGGTPTSGSSRSSKRTSPRVTASSS
jgi:hypothetical protein